MNGLRNILLSVTIIICSAFSNAVLCTTESPSPISKEDLVRKFGLQETDKIIIKTHFSENYFSAIHKAFDYQADISEPVDIKVILSGLKDINKVNAYQLSPEGQLFFYSGGKEIFKCGFMFFQYSPVLIIENTWYMFYSRNRDSPEEVIYKYMPPEFNQGKERLRQGIKEGRIL